MAKKQCTGCGDRREALAGYEAAIAFAERTTRRLWAAVIILVALLVAVNAAWLIFESQNGDEDTQSAVHFFENSATNKNNTISPAVPDAGGGAKRKKI